MKPGTFERIYPSSGDSYSKPGILLILRILLSAALLGVFCYVKFPDNLGFALPIAAALIAGYDIVVGAVRDIIRKRRFSSENLTVTIAVALSFAIGRGTEGVIALLLLQLSYIIRNYALFKTYKTICEVIEPDRKMLKGADTDKKGQSAKETYPVGSQLVIFEGITVPVDCVIKEGSGTADLSFITGSDKDVLLGKGDYLPAGSVCTDGQFVAEAAELPENALYRKIASVLKAGYGEMTETEKSWIKGTAFFVPAALLLSVSLILVLHFVNNVGYTETIRRIITIIAVASPCGVLLPIPLTWFSGVAAGRRAGIMFSHAKAVESSALIKAVVFNKVGTLTDRDYLVTDIKTDKMDPATFLKVAAYAASFSTNYLSKAIKNAFGEEINSDLINEFTEYPDQGVSVTVDAIHILLGIRAFLSGNGVEVPDDSFEGTRLHMSVNGIYAGRIELNENIKSGVSAGYLRNLAKADVDRIAMVSGESREKDRLVANELGIDEYYAECTTEEKILRIQEIKGRIDARGKLAVIGDCVTGEKLFEAADVGITINGASCHEELPKTDVVILEDGVGPINAAIRISRRTKSFVIRGAIFACCVKLLIFALAALGFAPVWFGLLIDFCASLAVLLNCTRVYIRDTSE